jgi:hypothetical protein
MAPVGICLFSDTSPFLQFVFGVTPGSDNFLFFASNKLPESDISCCTSHFSLELLSIFEDPLDPVRDCYVVRQLQKYEVF